MGLKKKPEKENLPASTTPIQVDDDDINDTPMTSDEDLTRLHDPPITTSSINNTNDCNMTNSDSVVNQDDELQSLVKILLELDGRVKGSKNDVQPVDAQFSSPKNIKRPQTVGRGRIREPLQKRSRKEITGDISKPQSEAYATGSSPASGSGTSTFLANDDAAMRRSSESWALVGLTSSIYNQKYLPPGFRVRSVVGQTPNIAGNMPPGFIYPHIPMAQITSGQLPFYGNSTRNMSPQPFSGGFAAFARGNPFPSIIQPVGQQFASGQVTPRPPIGLGIQVAESSNIQPVITNQFPARFGITEADLLGTQQRGHYQAPNVRHPMSFPSGQGIPRASNIHGQPPPGRRELESSLASWSTVRPRTKRKPYVPPALPPVVKQESPADSSDSTVSLESSPSPDSTPLIETIPSLQPSGEQCWLCKRDVSFTPDGPLSQPAMPPVVAILPCHHVFHAQCLEKITPKEQAEDPPCILCAIGEP